MTRILLYIILFVCVIFPPSLSAQQRDPILFGTYLASSNFAEITYHQFNDSNLVKLGFNTVLQTVMHPIIHDSLFKSLPHIWWDNRTALANSSFNNIVAMNGFWNQKNEQQVDWVKILTHGVYNKWEA